MDLADTEFNMDLVAPPYSQIPTPITAERRLNCEKVKQALIRAEIKAKTAEEEELYNLKKKKKRVLD